MEKREFKAESKRLLDIVINSIYTNREIFLRELISNASDAIDKVYYKTLGDSSLNFNKDDYYIKVIPNKEERTLTILDKGIGMTEEELDENLGVIAKSGSLQFKKENEIKDGFDIIGQFGVGFYSGFLVADKITVNTKAFGEDKAYKWESDGVDGYTISESEKDSFGTLITLHLKENNEDENYDEEETINSMVPLWRRNKNELTCEDYKNFYTEKRFGFDKPLRHMHISVDGMISYNSILYIPENIPYDYYTKEYEKGLELYSNGVLIMEKCSELLPDYFGFVKGIVDSQDLSLNISREMLQQDRQLSRIAKNIKTKIKNELESMMKNDRESYEKFYKSFGRQLKYGVYDDFGMNKDELKDLLMFYSSKEKKMVSLSEYVERMDKDQKYIYYAVGESNERIEKMPQTEMVLDKGYEILYFTEDVDEFAIKMLTNYKEKEFKSVSSGDLGIESEEENKKENEENKGIFEAMKEALGDKISAVKASSRLKNYPVCLSSEGEVSIEMEKILSAMPNNSGVKAQKVLEVNTNHEVFNSLKDALREDKEKFNLYTKLLYNQALLVEGLSIEDPVDFTNDICKLMK